MWLKMSWRDHRLAWDPQHYSGVNILRWGQVRRGRTAQLQFSSSRVSPNSLWKPDIALFNKQDLSNGILAADLKSSNTNVQLFSNGNILWISPVFHRILCEGITYSNWPWGTQMCNLSFGSWSYDSSDYQLQFYEDLVIHPVSLGFSDNRRTLGGDGPETVWEIQSV